MIEHLKIDEEFRTIIPPLTAEEYGNLERSLRMEGCRDAIRVWDGVIVDGHNRYEICRRWGIPFNVIQISFTSREAAISWICLNQLSRRNLTREAYKYLIGKRYDAEKSVLRNTAGRNQYSTTDTLESAVAQKTSRRLAKEYNLTHATVERYGKFSRSLDKIESEKPGILPSLLSGRCRISQRNLSALASLPGEKINAVVDSISSTGPSEQMIPLKVTAQAIEPQKKERKEKKKEQLVTKIKEMPQYNPDAEMNGLMYTIPTWIDMITRLNGVPVRYASEDAKHKMRAVLNDLQRAISDLREEMEDRR